MNKLWFKSKRYGWGWTPASWEGWLVTAVMLAFIIYNAFRFEEGLDAGDPEAIRSFIIQNGSAVIILILIAIKKGEKPRWRWGK